MFKVEKNLPIIISIIFSLIGCSNNESMESKKTLNKKDKDILSFSSSGSSSGPLQAREFCDIYMSSDAFIYGTIESIEFVETPFFIYDYSTGRGSLSETPLSPEICSTTAPSLKIDIKVDEFMSGHDLVSPSKLSLFIGGSDTFSMRPMPIMDVNYVADSGTRLASNYVAWQCDGDDVCGIENGEKIGFFAHNHYLQGYGDIWFLFNNKIFWSDEAFYKNTEHNKRDGILYSNVYKNKSLQDMSLSINQCSGYRSEEVEGIRNVVNNEIMNLLYASLPTCIPGVGQ